MIKITVDSENGKTSLFVIVKKEKIYFTNFDDIYYYSGVNINKNYTGTNQITLPIRRIAKGLEVIENACIC